MTNQQILTKAIQKANKNGFGVNDGWLIPKADSLLFDDDYKKLIFNHDFAKALWGEELVTNLENKYDLLREAVHVTSDYPSNYDFDYPLWIWHLQQMVIAPDPIKYLEEYACHDNS